MTARPAPEAVWTSRPGIARSAGRRPARDSSARAGRARAGAQHLEADSLCVPLRPGGVAAHPASLSAGRDRQPVSILRIRVRRLGVFPGRDAIIRLVGAVLAGPKHEWAEGHRNMGPEILAACRNPYKRRNQRDCAAINATGA
jgi:hypothetical protein